MKLIPEVDISNGFAVVMCFGVNKCSAANFQNLLQQSNFFQYDNTTGTISDIRSKPSGI